VLEWVNHADPRRVNCKKSARSSRFSGENEYLPEEVLVSFSRHYGFFTDDDRQAIPHRSRVVDHGIAARVADEAKP
jgi:hypothetical protein